MFSDAKLGHFEVITPQQYKWYPWCTGTETFVSFEQAILEDAILFQIFQRLVFTLTK